MNIAELQKQFSRHLLHQDVDLSSLNITGPFPVQQLMSLYRSNFYISLIDYLQTCFPNVVALVGDDFFAQLAKNFIITKPLECASIEMYGESFASFIEDCEQTQSLPYLSGVASLDWSFDRIQSMTRVTPFPFDELQQLTAEQQLQIRFELHSETLLLAAESPILKIWLGVKSGNLDGIDMQQGEFVIMHPDLEQGVKYYTITSQQYQFLNNVICGQSLQELATLDDFQLQLNHFISIAVINNFILEGES